MRTQKSTNEKGFIELLKKSNKSKKEIDQQEHFRSKLEEELNAEANPIYQDVLKAGIKLNKLNDFLYSNDSYVEALPALVKHLDKQYHSGILETIVRALAVKEARGIGLPPKLLELYNKVPLDKEYEGFRWAITNTIWYVATKKDREIIPELEKIINNQAETIDKKRLIATLKKLR